MARKEFYSKLFQKHIKIDDPEYHFKVLGEALYKLKEYEAKKCTCMICQDNEKKLREYLDKKLNFKNLEEKV